MGYREDLNDLVAIRFVGMANGQNLARDEGYGVWQLS
jgi:hypothetical protein